MSELNVNFNAESNESPPEGGTETVPFFRKALGFVGELLHVVIISLAIILPIRYFLIQPFYVKGASMEPNFYDHEYLIIDEISYRLGEPERGDIVVFRYPGDPRQFFIKRIIGLPGERVVVSGGQVTLYSQENPEGTLLEEGGYLNTSFTPGDKDVELEDEQYFLMGDNRTASMDSRSFGPVPRNFIVGKVWFRGWPPEKMGFLPGPMEYSFEESE
ncbi:MAG: signal peptidase I [Patescibacteria group bacterium]|nr:signal peptidase I [Patescibacteria group bacterium]